MDKHTYRVLEFDKVLAIAAAHARLESARVRLRNSGSLSPETAEKTFQATDAMLKLSGQCGWPPISGASAVSHLLGALEPRDASLRPEEYLTVAEWLKNCRRVFEYGQQCRQSDLLPDELSFFFLNLSPHDEIIAAIEQCILPDGSIPDKASKTLAGIRREIKSVTDRIHHHLHGILHSTDYTNYFQEKLVTLRNDRFVIPLKATHNGRLNGIIHDRSSSGETIFIEPAEAVQDNNLLKQLMLDEEKEIQRILRELGNLIRSSAVEILHGESLMIDLDCLCARAKFARRINGCRPEFSDAVELMSIRHPLLKDPVPVDICIKPEHLGLVITGPNTGGKTVALKTLGLAVMLANSGFFIPAKEGSTLRRFSGISCDIGDEQSIEQNLSTFSAHMSHIIAMLKNADRQRLILLDELGAGTDPQEGAALGIAVLEYLVNRGITVVATTHYSSIKNYAYLSNCIVNASVEFDLETLRPSYRLLTGIPGASRALEIASRLGLPEELLQCAYRNLDNHAVTTENLMLQIESDLAAAREIRRKAVHSQTREKQLEEQFRQKINALEKEKEQLAAQFSNELKELKKEARQQINAIIQSLRAKQAPPTAKEESEIKQQLNNISLPEVPVPETMQQELEPLPGSIEPGDTVFLTKLQRSAAVISCRPEKHEATVALGSFQTVVSLNDLQLTAKNIPQKVSVSFKKTAADPVSPVLDIRGFRYHEAQEQISDWLENAALQGMKSLSIIHGKGTGALRQAVEEILAKHPLITEYHYASLKGGGYGVTEMSLE